MIYKGLSQNEIEKAYNNRAAVSNHADFITDWLARSKHYRDQSNCLLDIEYGPGKGEKFDFFLPEDECTGIMIFIHGGYWQAIDKSYVSFIAESYCRVGIAVAVVSYPLCPAATMSEIIHAVRSAYLKVNEVCLQHGIGSSKIFLAGHSAGGHLGAALLTEELGGLTSKEKLISGCIFLSGLYDLAPMRYFSMGKVLNLSESDAQTLSPINNRPVFPVSMILSVGALESEEYHRQSKALLDTWVKFGCDINYRVEPEIHHFSILNAFCDESSKLYSEACELMGVNCG